MRAELERNRRPTELALLGGFELRHLNRIVVLPLGAQRLLAFLGLHQEPLLRGYIAETLWPEGHRHRANANLRSVVWRVRQADPSLLEGASRRLGLAAYVRVDVREQMALARELLHGKLQWDPRILDRDVPADLSADLLPDWFDEWLPIQRDRWNQLRLHALEAVAEHFLALGRFSEALESALAAVWAEPLRESGHRVLIRIHAAEGNWSEAISQYNRYRQLLHRELRVLPTPQMETLIQELTPR